MTFARPPAGDDPAWPRASAWLAGELDTAAAEALPLLGVVGVLCSVGSISPSRADTTPSAVRAALARLSTWDPVTQVDLAQAVRAVDHGDWPVAELALEPALADVQHRAAALPTAALHVFLGGDNAITRPLVAGLHGPDLASVGLVTLDAHHDVRHLADGPRNGTPVRGLVDDGLDPTNVVQVGINRFTNSAPYAAWCRDRGIHVVTVGEIHRRGIGDVVAEALGDLDGCRAIHVDLDIDVLDVAHAPACPGARPGGMAPHQLFDAATALAREPRVTSMDLVEVDAMADHDGRTVMAAAMALLAAAAGLAARTDATP